MKWLFAYPRMTLGQLLVLMAFYGFVCSIWIGPARPLLSPPRAVADLELANRSPLAAAVCDGSVALIECPSGAVKHRFRINHQHAPPLQTDWQYLPVAQSYGHYLPAPGNAHSYSAEFTEDDRFLKVRSYGHEPMYRSVAITVIEIATGRQATWNGIREDHTPYPEVIINAEGAKIHANGKVVAELAAHETPHLASREAKNDSSIKDWKIWLPDWETFFDQNKLVRFQLVNESDMRSLETLAPLGNQGEASIVMDEWGTYYPFLYDTKTGHNLRFQNPPDPNSEFAIESLAQAGYFVVGRQTLTPHDKLGTKEAFACWNIKTGRLIALPSWANLSMHVGWTPQIREFDGNLLVTDGDSHLTWIDGKSGNLQELYSPRRFAYVSEIVLAIWATAWFVVTRNIAARDSTRVLGYLLAVTVSVVVLTPSFDAFGLSQWRSQSHWLFSFGCLLPLVLATLISMVKRTASLPLLGSSVAAAAMLVAAWYSTGQHQDNRYFEKISLTLRHDLDPDEAHDFFRPWRFGAPKPDPAIHFQFRDRLAVAEEPSLK